MSTRLKEALERLVEAAQMQRQGHPVSGAVTPESPGGQATGWRTDGTPVDRRAFMKEAIELAQQALVEAEIEETHEATPDQTIVVLDTNCAPVINSVYANVPGVKVIILDQDTEGCDDDGLAMISGEEVWVGIFVADEDVMGVADVCTELITQGRTP